MPAKHKETMGFQEGQIFLIKRFLRVWWWKSCGCPFYPRMPTRQAWEVARVSSPSLHCASAFLAVRCPWLLFRSPVQESQTQPKGEKSAGATQKFIDNRIRYESPTEPSDSELLNRGGQWVWRRKQCPWILLYFSKFLLLFHFILVFGERELGRDDFIS